MSPHRGRWRVRATIDGEQKSLGVYETREAAEDVLAGALAELGADPSTTLRGWGRAWLDARERSGLKRDVAAERSRWKYVESQRWIDEPIAALTSKSIRAWVKALLARPLARQTVANALNLLRVCLEDAVEDEIIEANPARTIRVPKVARTDEPWTYLRPGEIAALLNHEKLPAKQRAVYALAIYTGAREGEIFGVHWRDVHLTEEQPRITFRFCWRKPRKNGKPLTVPLLPAAVEILREWRRARPSLPSGLVFPSDDGSPHTKGYDAQWAERWREETGTREDVRFHDLRHTCGASLVSGVWGRAWRLEEVQAFLGHDSRSSTERYAHLAPEAVHGAAAATLGSSRHGGRHRHGAAEK